MKTLIHIGLLAFFLLAGTTDAMEILPTYNLSVSFDLKNNLIKGTATIVFPEEGKAHIDVSGLTVLSVKRNGQAVSPEIKNGKMEIDVNGALEIVFEATFSERQEEEIAEDIGVPKKIVSDQGIYLTDAWYPAIDGMAAYNLKVFLPPGFSAISEADEVTISKTQQGSNYAFIFPHPLPGIHLIAGRYRELKETINGIAIYGYFLREDFSLAKAYLEYAKRCLKQYGDSLTPFPYKRFSLVESFLPAGESMPTFSVLDREIMQLPALGEFSLRQGILNQWLGNLIFSDLPHEYWPGGLTSYLAGRVAEEKKGEGWQYRKDLIVDYENYADPEKKFHPKDFAHRNTLSPMAIGYGKGAMFFHMLGNLVGKDSFYSALKKFIREKEFKKTSRNDLRIAFEKASGEDLEWFFFQWLDRKEIPSIEIKDPNVVVLKGFRKVSFDIVQKSGPFQLNLPVAIQTDKGEVTKILTIRKEKETFEIPVPGNPVEIIVDRDYDLMRRLSEEEYPPVISRLLGDEKRLVVIPAEEEERRYSDLIGFLKRKGVAFKKESEIKDEDVKNNSLLIPGFKSPVLKRLFGDVKKPASGFTLAVMKNPLNPLKVIAVANADSKEEVSAVINKLFLYERYSTVRFEKGGKIGTDIAETERGIRVNIHEPVTGIQPKKTMRLDEIIPKILDKPVIYLGERHGNFEDHRVQLKVIMALHESGHKFAIGMEMFQKPFQKAINDYQSGIINERDFLKATQYFKRWQFDYNLYREIIEYAKANNIPIVALNMWSEIVKTVAAAGLDALTDSEKAQIPEDMDMSDEDYNHRLKEIFETHKNHGSIQFDNFYQAQILWDETMAHAANVFLKKNPDYQMAVLAGVGHIIYGSGIPKRAFRLNGKEYVTVIPVTGEPIEDSGDFVLFPEHISPPDTVKLGIISKKTNGNVIIEKIQPGSSAEKAGLKNNDVLISIDDWKIEDIDDVRISLFDKKHGDRAIIKLLRNRFLSGYTELQFTITL